MVAIKAVDDKELNVDKPDIQSKSRLKLFCVRTLFVLAWLSFSVIIFIIAILIDINWMRPSLEQVIGQSIHRNVKLGRLSWNLGLHGFSVDTSRLLVADRTGEPFLMAGDCEIGFSLWPMLVGVSKIQYVDMQKPLFMAVHTGPKSWNFDDLLLISPDIDFIQIHSGHIFVVDRQPANNQQHFADTELNDVQVKFERAGNFTPAQMNVAFTLPTDGNKATYNLAAKAWDNDKKPWWDRKCQAELTAKRFTMQNWQTITALASVDSKNLAYSTFLSKITAAIPKFTTNANAAHISMPRSGQFDFHGTAEGVPSKKIQSNLQLKVDDLVLCARDNSILTLPEASLNGQIEFTPDTFVWNKCVIRVPDYKLFANSSGSILVGSDGLQHSKQWSFVALLGDLKKLNPFFEFAYNYAPGDTTISAKNLFNNLNGKLLVDVRLDNEQNEEVYSVEAKANDVNIDGITPLLLSVNKLVANKVGLNNPFDENYLKRLDLSTQAKFSGMIIGKSGEGVAFKDCSFDERDMSWKFAGQLDNDGHWQELTVSNKDLLLNKLSEKMNQDEELGRQIKTTVGLNPASRVDLDGNAQISAKLFSDKNKDSDNPRANNFSCEVKFDNASLKTSQPRLDLRHLQGTYLASANSLTCKNIHFTVGNGSADIDASMSENKKSPLHFSLQAKNINVNDLHEILLSFHLDTSSLDSWHLSGKLADIDIQITGTPASPDFTINASPSDLAFNPPGLKQSIHATSGRLTYGKNALSLEKVTISSSSAKCLVSLVLKNPAGANKLERLSVQTSGADLSDLQTYLAAAHLLNYQPIKKYQIANLKGNVSGSLEYHYHQDKPKVNGTFDFDGLSFKWGQQKSSCKNLKGRAVLADSDLILHDVTGSMDNTPFALHGRLYNYSEASKDRPMQWHGEMAAQIAPENINSLLTFGNTAPAKASLALQAKKPIYIKLKSPRNANAPLSFTLIADADAGLSVSSGNMTFSQPMKKLIVNGVYTLDEQKLNWRSLNLDFAGNCLNIQGTISNSHNPKIEPIYDLQIQTSESFPASYFGQIFSNGVINGELTGQIKANLFVQGSAKAPAVIGKVYFIDLSVPDLYLGHLTGNIAFRPNQGNTIPSLLQLDKANLGPIEISQGSGELIWQSDLDQVSLKNFLANIAQGKFTSEALVDLKSEKLHLTVNVDSANLTQLWPQITNMQIKAAGLFNGNFTVDTTGSSAKALEQNMVGSGHIHVTHGSFSRLSQLHAKLNQVNLLRQGIFGFNLNNVMQSVLPAKASEFNSIDSAFALNDEVITIRQILYDGKDIKFSSAGKVNLALHTLDLDIAGLMPRVSNSVLGGKLGELSREITLQKLLDGVTMHKLEKLPSIPLIGGIAGGPEIFTCRIVAPYDQPKMISQSIEKSFHWLHNHN